MEINFDYAIELLEITDISKIQQSDLAKIEKKAKKRWHPDNVAHLNNTETTLEYQQKFQAIEVAIGLITSYLNGSYNAGQAFTSNEKATYTEPEEIIRSNATRIQENLRSAWPFIKSLKFRWELREIILSDGFKLRDLLSEDFREDIAMLSIVSFFYGFISIGILGLIGEAISPTLGILIGIVWLLQALSCLLGLAPLSRFWLPDGIQNVVLKFINWGLGIYNWAEDQISHSTKWWVVLLVRLPVLFAKAVKYIILFPLYELAKAIVGDKIVGVVKKQVNYYADAAEWYIEELLNKKPESMNSEELFHLSYLYTELMDVKREPGYNSTQTL